ncbi:hypothetical protein BC940DRAFT_349176 [Gongronella butleri]|nr:hypothetical protein BC940DRAFT_349176 [Gongronella butleri]
MLMTASSAETLCTSDLATAPSPPDTMTTNSATTGSNTISESDTRDHAHDSTTCAASELERLLEQDASMRKRLKRPWMPPINSDTLQELAMPNVFRSIQLRHDLVFDQCLSFRPNLDGSSGRDKINKAERYWRRVDRAFQDLGTDAMQIDDLHHPQRLAFLRVILEELASILVSLRAPYASSPAANEPWPWPANVSLRHVKAVMDVDLILQQIHHAIYDIDPLVKVVSAILHPLCPAHEAPRLQLLHRYVQEKKYAKALRQCFSILEAIKLAYEIPSVPFPIVLQFDERRLLQQFRQEFQSMMLVSLLLIPYRYYAGSYSSTGDIVKLKRLCVQVCWDMHATGFPVMASLQDRKDVMHLYHRLVYKACHRGLAARARRDASAQPLMEQKEVIAPFTPRQLAEDAAQLWACWLITHLDPASAIYKLMYERMCHLLAHLSQHGPNLDENATNAMERMVGIQENILALGEKIKLLTDLNLATFGPIFKWLAKDISENHLHPAA